ncbi:hypothetical protein PMZ80_001705 [Knufia obscura]|uniref:Uncharacterized protein n=2 Tax=Knufia TaxID=430999 RepID=A0AAN8EWY0_9EURO|nr:hypothetical protein PMZ80_001705 [Knufia obscura]KAK5955471.1 hypothetical protein OHC33_003109 [Knufia fluminis]
MTAKKVVLITGCSDGGLGSALALAFHETGQYRVVATARDLSKLGDTRAAGIEELELDIVSKDSVSACAQKLEALTGGHLDLLINNAGTGYNMPVLDINLDEGRRVFDVNVWSLITVSRAFLPLLMKTPNAKIANNVSVAAYASMPLQGVYNASKAAANLMTETLRLELKPFGIGVVSLMTGSVKTNFYTNIAQQGHWGSLPDDSIYRVVPGGLKMMQSQDAQVLVFKDSMDATTWARQVVGDLSPANPPIQIWRGTKAWLIRLVALLPTGILDSVYTKASKLDELEKALAGSR